MNRFILLGVRFPWITLLLSLVLMALVASGLPRLYKDTSADAFLAKDNPALVYKNKAKETFGISDPIVIAIEDRSAQGVYRPATLALVRELTEAVDALPNINESRTFSLATEDNIVGNSSGMDVMPFMELEETDGPNAVREAIRDFPLYNGLLVSEDGAMTLIIAEMIDDNEGEATYQDIEAITQAVKTDTDVSIYTAGEGAVLGYLGHYIDQDASRLNPLAGLIITIMLFVAFRRFAPALLGNVLIAATVLMTMGLMAYSNVPFFVITNAMPVILIGMAVADSIHIFSRYYEVQAQHPELSQKQAIEQAVVSMFWPVTLTTLTTMSGFFGLYAAAYMPPFQFFGLFTAFGVFVAWLYSIYFLPAAITLLKPKVSKKWVALAQEHRRDLFSRIMEAMGGVVVKHSGKTVLLFTVISVIGLGLSSQVRVNENRINTFHKDEPVYIADHAINQYMEGTNTLDVVIETGRKEGLFDPMVLAKMEQLQQYGESLPHINGSISIADYLKQMNKALHSDQSEFDTLPENADLVAQYLLLYSASGDPSDFENVVDYDYRTANIRFYLDTSEFVKTKPVVEDLQRYLDGHFSDSVSATLTGRVNVNYHWIKDIGSSHFLSVGIALLCVYLVAMLLFRSPVGALFAVLPVVSSILTVYAAMVLLKIDLGIGTSMFASVAIGLGVDFAIHTIDRLKQLFAEGVPTREDIISRLYASTGRALLFNYLAIAFGFGVLISSRVVPLNNFGSIVVLSVTMSFIASLVLLPALVLYFKPRYFYADQADGAESKEVGRATTALGVLVVLLATLGAVYVKDAKASTELTGTDIVKNINAVNDGNHVVSDLTMTLTDKHGKVRTRDAISYRKYFGDEKRTLFLYRAPTNVKGTSFLTYDYSEQKLDDDQWLYLPALRKVRRIPSSDRGDYFLGTDFSYEDIKQAGKIELTDFHFTVLGEQVLNQGSEYEAKTLKVEAVPVDDQVAQELGYGKVVFWVNPDNWVVMASDYWDPKGRYLKTYTASDIRQVDGIWTRHVLEVTNHKTGHSSRFEFSNVDYQAGVDDDIFTRRYMERGR